MRAFELFGEIFLRDNGANRSLGEIEGSARRADGALGKGIATAAKWGGAMVLAAGAAAAAIGGVALKAAVSYEKQMANVATLLDGDVKTKIGNMSAQVKKMSSETGTSTELLTDGLYQVVSAFGETDDAMKILEISTKGAAAGNATVTDSVNLLSAVTKGYGDTSAKAAQQTSDLAFLTVKLGQTDFPSLAQNMGKVIPLAGAMKVSQEELFGAMATLTGVTGGTAEVTTQLRGTIQAFMKPSESMSAALKGMGYETGAAALESLGLNGALTGLKESVGGNTTELGNMFGSVEAGTAVLALTGSQADIFTEKTKAMAEAAGATEAAFKTQQATVSAMMQKMTESFNVVMITLGEKLLPMFNNVLEWVIKHMPEIKQGIDNAMTTVSDVVEIVITKFQKVIEVGKEIAETIFPNLNTKSFDLGETIKELTTKAFDILITALTWVRDNIPLIKGVVIALTTVWITQKGIVLASNIALLAHNVQLGIAKIKDVALTASIVALYIAQGIGTAATTAGSVAMAAFNLVMSLNPIAIVILALVALGVGIVALVKNWETVTTAISKAWNWLTKWNKEPTEDKSTTVTTNRVTKYSSSGIPRTGGTTDRGYATGTTNATKGLHWVGEKGPELLNFNGGETIKNAKDSAKIASSKNSGFNLNIETFVNERKQDVEELAEELSYYIKKKELGGV